MKQRKYIDGKEVPKRLIQEGESLPKMLKRLVDLLEIIDLIPSTNDPTNPHNWHGDDTLKQKEFDRRYQIHKTQNASKEDLLKRLIDMEMVVAYENYFNYLLIKPYITSREAIFQSYQHVTKSGNSRTEAKSRKFDPQRKSAIALIHQIQKSNGCLHQNDYGNYIIKISKLTPPLSKSTARKYWLEETGFKSTKKIDIT